jgi:hypothetical protein
MVLEKLPEGFWSEDQISLLKGKLVYLGVNNGGIESVNVIEIDE